MAAPDASPRIAATLAAAASLLAVVAPLVLAHTNVVPPPCQGPPVAGTDPNLSPSDCALLDLNIYPTGVDGDANGAPWNCRQFPQNIPSVTPPPPPPPAPPPPPFDLNSTINRYFTLDAVEYLGFGGGKFLDADAPILRSHVQNDTAGYKVPEEIRGENDAVSVSLSPDGFIIADFGSPIIDAPGPDLKVHVPANAATAAHFCVYGSMSPPDVDPDPVYTFIGSSFASYDQDETGVYFDLARFYTPFAAENPDPADQVLLTEDPADPTDDHVEGLLQYVLIEASHTKHPQIVPDFSWPQNPFAEPPEPNLSTFLALQEASDNYGHPLWGNDLDDQSVDPIVLRQWTLLDGDGVRVETKSSNSPAFLYRFPMPSECQTATVDLCPFQVDPHQICVIVTTTGGPGVLARSVDTCKPVIVYNLAPRASFLWHQVIGKPGLVEFKDASTDPDPYNMPPSANPATGFDSTTGVTWPTSPSGPIDAWEWDFEFDGTFDPHIVCLRQDPSCYPAALQPTFQYQDTACHLVALRVTDTVSAIWRRQDTLVSCIYPGRLPPTFPPLLQNVTEIHTTLGQPIHARICATDQDNPDPADWDWEFFIPEQWVTSDPDPRVAGDEVPGPLHGLNASTVAEESLVDQNGCFVLDWPAQVMGSFPGLYLTVTDPQGHTSIMRFRIVVTPAFHDSDGDGVPDGADTCPILFNPGQGLGCDRLPTPLPPCIVDCDVDLDGDGILGRADNCPNDANVGQENLDDSPEHPDALGDACDPDRDGDGVEEQGGLYDILDNCPMTYNPEQVDADADGTGDACQRRDVFRTRIPASTPVPQAPAPPGNRDGASGDGGLTRVQGLVLSGAVVAGTALLVGQALWMRRRGPPGGGGAGPQG